jgi:hypothetical protein
MKAKMPVVEWTINIGTVAALLFAAAGFYFVTKSDMRVMKDNVVAIKTDLESLTVLMKEVAVQKNTLDYHASLLTSQAGLIKTLDERLYDLSKGKGFIRQEIDGVWPK